MDNNQENAIKALDILIQGVQLGCKAGAYTLVEAAQIQAAVEFFMPKKTEEETKNN